MLKDSYLLDDDHTVLGLNDDYGVNISDPVLHSGVYEILGNSSLNINKIDIAINNFKKAHKLLHTAYGSSIYKINHAEALILKEDFINAISILNEIINDEIAYSYQNKAEELLAIAKFSKDN